MREDSSGGLLALDGLSLLYRITLGEETPPSVDFISASVHTTLESLLKDDKRAHGYLMHTLDMWCHYSWPQFASIFRHLEGSPMLGAFFSG